MVLSRTVLGMVSAVAASALFSFNDMAIKFVSGDYALHQVVLIRSTVGLILITLVLMPLSGGFVHVRTQRLGMHLLRSTCVVLSNMLYFLGLAVLPIAEAVALFFVAPLLITVFSVVFLGESVGPRRWLAVAVGLLGVLVMLRPGTGTFQPAALLVVAAALAYSAMHMFTRRLGGTEGALTMAFYIQLSFVVVGILFGLATGDGRFETGHGASLTFLLRAWVWPAPGDWPILIAIGIASGLGGLLIGQAYRLCEAGLVAPFEYVALPMAVVWGVMVFAQWPDGLAWVGIALILGAGLYMVWRESVIARQQGKAPLVTGTVVAPAASGLGPDDIETGARRVTERREQG